MVIIRHVPNVSHQMPVCEWKGPSYAESTQYITFTKRILCARVVRWIEHSNLWFGLFRSTGLLQSNIERAPNTNKHIYVLTAHTIHGRITRFYPRTCVCEWHWSGMYAPVLRVQTLQIWFMSVYENVIDIERSKLAQFSKRSMTRTFYF